MRSPVNATFNCTFLSGFTGSARCRVQYGTDPTYMNLPYSAESDEAGTAGDSVIVVLREQLNSTTVYYFTVSAVGGDVIVNVLAESFTTPEYSKWIRICTFWPCSIYIPLGSRCKAYDLHALSLNEFYCSGHIYHDVGIAESIETR